MCGSRRISHYRELWITQEKQIVAFNLLKKPLPVIIAVFTSIYSEPSITKSELFWWILLSSQSVGYGLFCVHS